MKRALIAIFLLACFILPLGGSYILLVARRDALRSESKQRLIASLDRTELVEMILGSEEIKTLSVDLARQEFERDGLMFDIVYSAQESDSTRFWCWPDHQETDLNLRLDDLAAKAFGSDTKSREVQHELLNFLTLLYCEKQESIVYNIPVRDLMHGDCLVAITEPIYTTDTPPPRS